MTDNEAEVNAGFQVTSGPNTPPVDNDCARYKDAAKAANKQVSYGDTDHGFRRALIDVSGVW